MNPCPFCGSEPTISRYATLTIIECLLCKEKGRTVKVFGDGPYSSWCKTQTSENGVIKLDSKAVYDETAIEKVKALWNERV